MTKNEHATEQDAAPVAALARLLDCLWEAERDDYAAAPAPSHVFHALVDVANWLTGSTLTADEHVTVAETVPNATWRETPAAPGGTPHWVYEGAGSRYRVRGFKPSVTVVVGWDRPLHTFFAQVWDVPVGARHHEHGTLLLWAGTGWNEVPSVDALATLLEEHVSIPDDLGVRLEGDKLPPPLGREW